MSAPPSPGAAVVAVSSNPAVDRLSVVPDARSGGVRHASRHLETAGGKAAHVVTVAGALGADARLVAAADDRFRAWLDVPATVVPAGATRGTYTIVDADGGDVLEIHEPGRPVERDVVAALLREAVAAAASARVTVCAGSLAPGLPVDLHAHVAVSAGGFAIVYTSDRDALAAALRAAPGLVKPNLDEARALLGDGSAPDLAIRLREAGARYAWVSLGADGSVLAGPDGLHRLRGPARDVVNAVGAGDALVGGFAAGLARGLTVLEAARLGVAAATDKVGRVEFARVDPAAVQRLLRHVTIERIGEP